MVQRPIIEAIDRMAETGQDSRRYLASWCNPQNVKIDVANKPYFATRESHIPYSRHRDVVAAHAPDWQSTLPVECQHGVGLLPLKPSCSQKGPVLEEVWGILVHPQNLLAGVAK